MTRNKMSRPRMSNLRPAFRPLVSTGIGRVATSIRTENNITHVRFHDTDVVSFNPKTITLKSGGWRTNTTKKRMNQVSQEFNLGFNVVQEKFDWFVLSKGKKIPFKEGMIIRR